MTIDSAESQVEVGSSLDSTPRSQVEKTLWATNIPGISIYAAPSKAQSEAACKYYNECMEFFREEDSEIPIVKATTIPWIDSCTAWHHGLTRFYSTFMS